MTLAQQIKHCLAINEVLYIARAEKEEWIDMLPYPEGLYGLLNEDRYPPKPDDTPRKKNLGSNEDFPSD